jgi:hypothetical protein
MVPDAELLTLIEKHPEDAIACAPTLDEITRLLLDKTILVPAWRSSLQWECIGQAEQYRHDPRQVSPSLRDQLWPEAPGVIGRIQDWIVLPAAIRDSRFAMGLAVDLAGVPTVPDSAALPDPLLLPKIAWLSPVIDARSVLTRDRDLVLGGFTPDVRMATELARARFRAAHGTEPRDLADLVPRYLPDDPDLVGRFTHELDQLHRTANRP